ncbi:hypothetical protein GW17_00046699 [Ensete ventricosum]|nr:hypothetical protein GW17_00046699 [Ensete ventricosum]
MSHVPAHVSFDPHGSHAHGAALWPVACCALGFGGGWSWPFRADPETLLALLNSLFFRLGFLQFSFFCPPISFNHVGCSPRVHLALGSFPLPVRRGCNQRVEKQASWGSHIRGYLPRRTPGGEGTWRCHGSERFVQEAQDARGEERSRRWFRGCTVGGGSDPHGGFGKATHRESGCQLGYRRLTWENESLKAKLSSRSITNYKQSVLMRFGGARSPFPFIWRKISVRVELRGVVGGCERLKSDPSILLLDGLEVGPRGCSVRGHFYSSRFPTIRVSTTMKWFALYIISGTMVGGFSTKD